MKDWRMWAHGLVSAMIGGAATSVLAGYVAPEVFFKDLQKLTQMAIGGGLFFAFAYLKESPLPKIRTHVVRTEKTITVEEKKIDLPNPPKA